MASALACLAIGGDALIAQSPKPGKPIPVPTRPMEPLVPAIIDDTLAIAGDDIEARKIRTRMTVDVRINGKGPFRFLVDSGADSSVVGLRLAQQLQLPLTTPVTLHGMTGSARVDRVMVDELVLGSSIVQNLELPALKEQDLG